MSGWVLADRIDLPFVTVPVPKGAGRISGPACRFGHTATFGRRWSGEWKAWPLLAEFTDSRAWRNRQRRRLNGTLAAAGPGGLDLPEWQAWLQGGANAAGMTVTQLVDRELDALVLAAETERADALGEILSQNDAFTVEFSGLLGTTPSAYPATESLMGVAMLVGLLAAQHFKWVNNRPRPSQVCPALRPPVEVPGHAAYPSGHATQAFLVSRILASVLTGKDALHATAAVEALAWRIARNREIAGLHYASDSESGEKLAEKLFAALKSLPAFRRMLNAAALEWK